MKFAGLTAEYRKKPVVVRAVRIAQSMVINTPGGTMQGSPGDWLITGIRDEQYFCKDDIFREAYEPVNGGWLDMPTVSSEGRVARCFQCFREHQRARCACEGCDPDW